MSLLTVRQAIIDTIKANITSLKTCEEHGGRFDVAELKRVAARSPAVYVSVLQISDIDETTGSRVGTVTWAVFVVAKSDSNTKRADVALMIVNALGVLIPNNRWGVDESEQKPARLSARNLFSASIDKIGVAMWAVTWQQRISLGGEVDLATLDDFITLNATHDIDTSQTGEPAAQDTIPLPQ